MLAACRREHGPQGLQLPLVAAAPYSVVPCRALGAHRQGHPQGQTCQAKTTGQDECRSPGSQQPRHPDCLLWLSPVTPLPQDPWALPWTCSSCPRINAAPVGAVRAMLLGLGAASCASGAFAPPRLQNASLCPAPFGCCSRGLFQTDPPGPVVRGVQEGAAALRCWGWGGNGDIPSPDLRRATAACII